MAVSKRRAILFVPLAIFLGTVCLLMIAGLWVAVIKGSTVTEGSTTESARTAEEISGCGPSYPNREGVIFVCDPQPGETSDTVLFGSVRKNFFGIGVAVLMVAGHSAYLYRFLKGHAKPRKITWLSITAISVGWFAIQYFEKSHSLLVFAPLTVTSSAIWLLSFKVGERGKSKLDVVIPTISVAGIIFWWMIWKLV